MNLTELERIFHEALATSRSEERVALLETACGPDTAAREKVQRLIEAHESASGCLDRDPPDQLDTAPPLEGEGSSIGRYTLLEEIGEGGFGVVYRARQREPVNREVALKIIKLGMDTRLVVARFEAERQALAMLDHPNIAKVLDGGTTETGRPYFVMELIAGVPLTDFCDDRRLDIRARLDLFIPVCHAVQHAHQRGIIHRDLKPSNILVTDRNDEGAVQPKVIDFGIAKIIDSGFTAETLMTQQAHLIGTPVYMSPEQIEQDGADIDTRSDIYSLGVLLYELLVGAPPFETMELERATLEEMRRLIRECEPRKPSARLALANRERSPSDHSRRSGIPSDLDWIVMKCLEKDRSRRYHTAHGLALDIKRHLANEPILARPPSFAYRLRKAWHRNKMPMTAAILILAALVAGVAVSSWQAGMARKAEQRATRLKSAAEVHAAAERRRAYAAEINVAFQALNENNLRRARELLAGQSPNGSEDDLRGFEWRYLSQLCQGDESATLRGIEGTATAISPDGKLLASGGNRITITNLESLEAIQEISLGAKTLAFSLDGNILACGEGERVTLLDTQSWEPIRSLPTACHPTVFSPDGRWLVTGAPEGYVIWNTSTWEMEHALKGGIDPGPVAWHLRTAVAFAPDGERLVLPEQTAEWWVHRFKVLEFPSLDPLMFTEPVRGSSAVCLLDSGALVVGTTDGTLLAWDVDSGMRTHTIRNHTGGVYAIAPSHDGRFLVTGSTDSSILILDGETLRPKRRLRGHVSQIWSLALARNDRLLVSGSQGGVTKIWNMQSPQAVDELAESSHPLRFCAGGSLLPVRTSDGFLVWNLSTGGTIELPGDDALHHGRQVDPGLPGRRVASDALFVWGNSRGELQLWNAASGTLEDSWLAFNEAVANTALSPDGRLLAARSVEGKTKIWSLPKGEEIVSFDHEALPRNPIVFSPDSRYLAVAGWSKVAIWDLEKREPAFQLPAQNGWVFAIAFAPEGNLLALGSVQGNEVQLLEFPSAKVRSTLPLIQGVSALAFSPDGRTLASGEQNGRAAFWNVATEQELLTLDFGRGVEAMRFSADGSMLAIGGHTEDGPRVRLYRAPTLENSGERENP